MIHVTIDETQIRALGLGTWPLTGDACVEAVADALSIGYRHVDTAQMYKNEGDVGKGISQSGVDREKVWVTTKIWPTHLTPAAVRQSTEESLRQLNTPYVDLLLIHWPSDQVPLEKTLEAMFALQHEQKTRHVGVSNFPLSLLQRAEAVGRIFCNQVEYHPFLSQQSLTHYCAQKNILLTAYSPLAHGKINANRTLQEIGQTHGKSPSQVTLRWLLQQPSVATIPKASSTEHRRSNFEIFDFTLSEEEMARIFALHNGQRLINPEFAPAWEC